LVADGGATFTGPGSDETGSEEKVNELSQFPEPVLRRILFLSVAVDFRSLCVIAATCVRWRFLVVTHLMGRCREAGLGELTAADFNRQPFELYERAKAPLVGAFSCLLDWRIGIHTTPTPTPTPSGSVGRCHGTTADHAARLGWQSVPCLMLSMTHGFALAPSVRAGRALRCGRRLDQLPALLAIATAGWPGTSALDFAFEIMMQQQQQQQQTTGEGAFEGGRQPGTGSDTNPGMEPATTTETWAANESGNGLCVVGAKLAVQLALQRVGAERGAVLAGWFALPGRRTSEAVEELLDALVGGGGDSDRGGKGVGDGGGDDGGAEQEENSVADLVAVVGWSSRDTTCSSTCSCIPHPCCSR
jgi:hypothetical protein